MIEPHKGKSLRCRLHLMLDPERRSKLSRLNIVLMVIIVASVTTAILETEANLRTRFSTFFLCAEVTFTTVFVIEYGLRLWTTVENPRFSHPVWGRLRWMATPSAIIDLIAIAPALFLLGGTSPNYVLRLFRLVRILRIAKLGRVSAAFKLMEEALNGRRFELMLSLGAAVMMLIITSTLMFMAEARTSPEHFGSIPRAMWWSVITLTTIGYGDVVPVTATGRVLAAVTAVIGISLIAAPTGILAAAFSEAMQKRKRGGLAAVEAAREAGAQAKAEAKTERTENRAAKRSAKTATKSRAKSKR